MKAGFSIKLILYFGPNCPQQIVAPNCPTPNCPRRIVRAKLSCAELSGHPSLHGFLIVGLRPLMKFCLCLISFHHFLHFLCYIYFSYLFLYLSLISICDISLICLFLPYSLISS